MDFGDWFQEQAGTVIGKWSDKQFAQPMVPINTLTQTRLGEAGYYQEGQPGVSKQPGNAAMSTNTKLMIGGAVALVVLLLVVKG